MGRNIVIYSDNIFDSVKIIYTAWSMSNISFALIEQVA